MSRTPVVEYMCPVI